LGQNSPKAGQSSTQGRDFAQRSKALSVFKDIMRIKPAISRIVWVFWYPVICLWHKMLCGRVTLAVG